MSQYLVILLIMVLFAVIARKQRIAIIALLISIVGLFLFGTPVLLNALLGGLQTEPALIKPEWKDHNVILLLGGGLTSEPKSHTIVPHFQVYPRILEAARLYQSCKNYSVDCVIVASGGDPARMGISEADVMRKSLVQLGVPETDVFLEGKSNNTFQNAQFTRELLETIEGRNIILVTSGFHMRRALLYFKHFAILATAAPADHWSSRSSYWPVFINLSMADVAIHEYLGILRFHFYNAMGWNTQPRQP